MLAGGAAALKKALSPSLKKGDRGAGALALQKALNGVGAALIEDGVFGSRTQAAVAAFQRDHGLRPVDGAGTVDEATWDAVRAGSPATASVAPGLGSSATWASMSAQQRADLWALGSGRRRPGSRGRRPCPWQLLRAFADGDDVAGEAERLLGEIQAAIAEERHDDLRRELGGFATECRYVLSGGTGPNSLRGAKLV